MRILAIICLITVLVAFLALFIKLVMDASDDDPPAE